MPDMSPELIQEYRALQYDLEYAFLQNEPTPDRLPREDVAGLSAYTISEHIRKIIELEVYERLAVATNSLVEGVRAFDPSD